MISLEYFGCRVFCSTSLLADGSNTTHDTTYVANSVKLPRLLWTSSHIHPSPKKIDAVITKCCILTYFKNISLRVKHASASVWFI